VPDMYCCFVLLQSKEIERLNGVYVNLLKNSGVEYIGAICVCSTTIVK